MACGRLENRDCEMIEAMVLTQVPFARTARAIVADDWCPPDGKCFAGFLALVSILVVRDPAMDYAYWPPTYLVNGDGPTGTTPVALSPFNGTLPAHFLKLLRSNGFAD
jgi:hypothetical protein